MRNKNMIKKSVGIKNGFTLIELVVVISVIGILASIVIVSYNSWRQTTTVAQLKSDLSNAASAMENYRTFNNTYPTSVPSSFTPSSGVTLTGGSLDGGLTYCVDAVNLQFTNLYYHIDSTNSGTGAQSGVCVAQSLLAAIASPSAPTVVANYVGATTTWSWGAASCPGNTARYQYEYTITPSGYNSGWVATAGTSVTFTTSTEGRTYAVAVQAQCYNTATSSSWSGSGAANYYRSIVFCPSGFIPVPGSSTYGTNDFCVMKYNAKADDNSDGIGDTNQTTGYNTWPADTYPISASRKLVSTAAGYPVANISQTTAITAASSYTNNCPTGCHLISEAEFLTIAQNVLSVASNWDNGVGGHTVGTGYIYGGHNDNAPANALVADPSDTNGYAGTGNVAPSNQKRTLTLSNGEVIWDMSGNIFEWTSGTSTTGQPGVNGGGFNYHQWTDVTNPGTISPNPSASATGIAGASGWNSVNGIGLIWSNTEETSLRGFFRGGHWNSNSSGAGILTLFLGYDPSYAWNHIGFRVSR